MIKKLRDFILVIWYLPHYVAMSLYAKECVQADINEWNKVYSYSLNFFKLISHYPEFRTLFYYRLKNHRVVVSLLSFLSSPMDNLDVNGLEIGHVVFFHPFSTYINCKSIGDGTIVRNNTTIGNKNNDNRLTPKIGKNVDIGVNSVIIGDIVVGDNAIIGAGSVVVKDVPEKSVVAGNPARILKYID